ncbi:stress responsive protein [Aureibacter tunicatorum]|nr:stress responsive protein [Aureibacter tunicatorum]
MWCFGGDKESNVKQAVEQLNSLKGQISEIETLETGVNYNESDAAYDLVLITTHKSNQDLEAYQVHPAHQKVASFIKTVVEKRVVVDFEY